jgi:hypothetical protein
MKVVRTPVSETEYALLEAYARAHNATIKETVREAIRKLALRDVVDSESPIFKIFPLTRKKGKVADASERHDFYLCGWDR